jgi:hypothetical protein
MLDGPCLHIAGGVVNPAFQNQGIFLAVRKRKTGEGKRDGQKKGNQTNKQSKAQSFHNPHLLLFLVRGTNIPSVI